MNTRKLLIVLAVAVSTVGVAIPYGVGATAGARGAAAMEKILSKKFSDSFSERPASVRLWGYWKSAFAEKKITFHLPAELENGRCTVDNNYSVRWNLVQSLDMTDGVNGFAFYVKDHENVYVAKWEKLDDEALALATVQLLEYAKEMHDMRTEREKAVKKSVGKLKNAEGKEISDLHELIFTFLAENKIGETLIKPETIGWTAFRRGDGDNFLDVLRKAVEEQDCLFYFDYKTGKLYAYAKANHQQKAIETALNDKTKKVTFDFKETPLEEALKKVLGASYINFEPDFKYRNGKLESFEDFAVTMSFKDKPMGAAFRTLLAEFALAYYIDEEGTMFITNYSLHTKPPFGEPPVRGEFQDVSIPLSFRNAKAREIGCLLWLLGFDEDRDIKMSVQAKPVTMTFKGQNVRAACAAALRAAEIYLEKDEKTGQILMKPNKKNEPELDTQTRTILGL